MNRTAKWIVWAILLLGALAAVGTSLWLAGERLRWEGQRRQVGLSVTGEALGHGGEIAAGTLAERFGYVALDAATLSAFAPFNLKPWPALAEPEAPLSNADVDALRAAGLEVVLVLSPLLVFDAARADAFERALDALDPSGVLLVTSALDWPAEPLHAVASRLATRGVWLGTVEFFEPAGLLALYRAGVGPWTRAHLIPARERDRLPDAEALARFERAVRERGFRLLLLNAKGEAAPTAADLSDRLIPRLERAGFALGAVPAAPAWRVPGWTLYALALGLLAVTVWLFQRLWLKRPWVLALVTAVAGGAFAWALGDGDEGRQFLALSAAIVWPMCLYRALTLLPDRRGLRFGLLAWGGGVGFTLLGGLIQAGFLSEPAYFLKLGEFRGVKLAFIEPVLVVLLWDVRRRGPGVWRRLWTRPLTWGDAALGAALLGAFVVLIARTGNDSFVPALPFEEAARGQLETWLHARPRFKVFLVGHPFLILWLAWGWRRWGDFGLVVLAAAFLGPVTVLNSFAHLHTPLDFTLLRAANGIVLGGGAGALLWAAARWGGRRWRPSASS